MLTSMGRDTTVRWLVVCAVGKVNIELDALDAGLVPARDMQVIALQPQLFQLLFQPIGCDTQVEQRPDKHIAADAAEDVQIQCFHGWLCKSAVATFILQRVRMAKDGASSPLPSPPSDGGEGAPLCATFVTRQPSNLPATSPWLSSGSSTD